MVAAGDDILAAHHAGTRYYSIGAGSFVVYGAQAWLTASYINIQSASNTVACAVLATINLPNGAIVTSFKAFWNRDDAAASGDCRLIEVVLDGGAVTEMAAADSDSSAGDHVVEDTTIANATIDNNTKRYVVRVTIDPNDSFDDVRFRGCLITYTVAVPLP